MKVELSDEDFSSLFVAEGYSGVNNIFFVLFLHVCSALCVC